jgi:two-component system KDP operon response regulator KdpE
VINSADMTAPTVLVVEDDRVMRRFLWEALDAQGFRVLEALTLAHAQTYLTKAVPELVLLDLGMPDGDGTELLRSLRQRSRVPVIVISGREGEDEKVAALDNGADDYLTKPFGIGELLARIRVAQRHKREKVPDLCEVIRTGPFEIDSSRHEARLDGTVLQLTPIEFRLLSTLIRNAGRVLTHRQLLREVWGEAAAHETHYVRVHISALRRKIEREPARPRWLVTEQGIGYRLLDN